MGNEDAGRRVSKLFHPVVWGRHTHIYRYTHAYSVCFTHPLCAFKERKIKEALAAKPGVLIFRFNYEKKEGIVMRQIVAACWTAKRGELLPPVAGDGVAAAGKSARGWNALYRDVMDASRAFFGCLLRESYCYWRHEKRPGLFGVASILTGVRRFLPSAYYLTIKKPVCCRLHIFFKFRRSSNCLHLCNVSFSFLIFY